MHVVQWQSWVEGLNYRLQYTKGGRSSNGEESPDTTGQIAQSKGWVPQGKPAVRTVPQRKTAQRWARVKGWLKRPPYLVERPDARKTPFGARPNRERGAARAVGAPQGAAEVSGIGCLDEWSPNASSQNPAYIRALHFQMVPAGASFAAAGEYT